MGRLQRAEVNLSRIGLFGSANSWSRIWLRGLGHQHFQHLEKRCLSVLQYPLPRISLQVCQNFSLCLICLWYSFLYFFILSFSLYSKSDIFLLTYLSCHRSSHHFCSVNLYSELLILVVAFFYILEFHIIFFHRFHLIDAFLFIVSLNNLIILV